MARRIDQNPPGTDPARARTSGRTAKASASAGFCRLLRQGLSVMQPRNTEDFLHMVFVGAALQGGTTVALFGVPACLVLQFPDGSYALVSPSELRADYRPTTEELGTRPSFDPVAGVLALLEELRHVEGHGVFGAGKIFQVSGRYGLC